MWENEGRQAMQARKNFESFHFGAFLADLS
jgi:hypothetical protein